MKDFSELQLAPAIAKAIQELGFTTPTPIQAQTIPTLLAGPTDFLGLAATGTGKTAAYGIPLLEKISGERPVTEAIVLCPTRELAKQITDALQAMGKHLKLQVLPIYGGSGYDDQIRGLKRGAHIVVATPGRLIDHMERGTLKLTDVSTVVLDEADEMISMGFAEDLERVFNAVKKTDGADKVNTWLFSATMQPELRRIADRYLNKPAVVAVNQTQMLSGTVEQIYYTLREEQKAEVVCRILDSTDDFHGLIFCQTKTLVDDLDRFLRERGFSCDQLHGDRSQTERERTLRRFKSKDVKVLVCTDVAARGLDVKGLTHVINFSIPRELDSYVHRIGRTGRSGIPGVAISLVTPSHIGLVRRIEKLTSSVLTRGTIPSEREVVAAKVRKIMRNFLAVQTPDHLLQIVEDGYGDEVAKMTPTQIITRFLALIHPELARTNERELGIDIRDRDERSDRNRSGFQGRRFSDRRGSGDRERGGSDRGGPRREDRRPAAAGGSRGPRRDDGPRNGGPRGRSRRDDYERRPY